MTRNREKNFHSLIRYRKLHKEYINKKGIANRTDIECTNSKISIMARLNRIDLLFCFSSPSVKKCTYRKINGIEKLRGVKNHSPAILTFDFIEAKKAIANKAG